MALALDGNTKFVDATGSVVSGGLLYFGVRNADPKTNPIAIYSDPYLNNVLANPQTTNSLGQAPANIYVSKRYSFRLSTSADVLIFEDPDNESAAPENVLFTLVLVAGTNVITASTGTNLASYASHQQFTFKTAAANTGAVTLNVNNLGAKSVVKNNTEAILTGDFAANQEIIVVYNSTNDNFEWVNKKGGDAFAFSLFHIRDEKTAGTNGGTFTSGAWQTRDLNTTLTNEISGASLAANVITLPAGTFYIEARAPARQVNGHKVKLRNTSDTSDVIIGSSETHDTVTTGQTTSFVTGRFTIAATKNFELQHQCITTRAANGFGEGTDIVVVEVYAEVKIWKVA